MPFDGTKLRLSLAEGVAALGITPISDSVLEEHKQAELAKHPGDWWYIHKTLADVLLGIGFLLSLLSFASMIISFFAAVFSGNPTWILVASGCAIIFFGIAFIIGEKVNGTVVKGPAEWHETTYKHNLIDDGVPIEIMQMAFDITNTVPNCSVVIGELKQDSVTLDPYLVIRNKEEQIVVGIWDGDTIIHQATRI